MSLETYLMILVYIYIYIYAIDGRVKIHVRVDPKLMQTSVFLLFCHSSRLIASPL